MSKREMYIVTDVKINGPTPGRYSMLSFASVACTMPEYIFEGNYTENLSLLRDAQEDPIFKEVWEREPKKWENCRKDCLDPEEAMIAYRIWLENLGKRYKLRFASMSLGTAFAFITYYLERFTTKSMFKNGIDIGSYLMARNKKPYDQAVKGILRDWIPENNIPVGSLKDADKAAHILCRITRSNNGDGWFS